MCLAIPHSHSNLQQLSILQPKGGKMRLYGLLGGKYVSMCKACGKLERSGGMLPWEILTLELLLDAIWWNLGLFLHKQFIVSLTLY